VKELSKSSSIIGLLYTFAGNLANVSLFIMLHYFDEVVDRFIEN